RHTRSKRDWSSDVCSSDLTALVRGREDFTNAVRRIGQEHPSVWIEKVRVETDHPREWVDPEQVADIVAGARAEALRVVLAPASRSEERRVGTVCSAVGYAD